MAETAREPSEIEYSGKRFELKCKAHINATNQNEEFVTEALLTMGKMELLVHELLVADAWQINVLPLISKDLSAKDTLRTYFLVF